MTLLVEGIKTITLLLLIVKIKCPLLLFNRYAVQLLNKKENKQSRR
jgi:hypothetical protein